MYSSFSPRWLILYLNIGFGYWRAALSNQVNVKVIGNLLIISFRPHYSHLLKIVQIEQKCLCVRGSEIELEVICHLENFKL